MSNMHRAACNLGHSACNTTRAPHLVDEHVRLEQRLVRVHKVQHGAERRGGGVSHLSARARVRARKARARACVHACACVDACVLACVFGV